jgi:hypothetical protein
MQRTLERCCAVPIAAPFPSVSGPSCLRRWRCWRRPGSVGPSALASCSPPPHGKGDVPMALGGGPGAVGRRIYPLLVVVVVVVLEEQQFRRQPPQFPTMLWEGRRRSCCCWRSWRTSSPHWTTVPTLPLQVAKGEGRAKRTGRGGPGPPASDRPGKVGCGVALPGPTRPRLPQRSTATTGLLHKVTERQLDDAARLQVEQAFTRWEASTVMAAAVADGNGGGRFVVIGRTRPPVRRPSSRTPTEAPRRRDACC